MPGFSADGGQRDAGQQRVKWIYDLWGWGLPYTALTAVQICRQEEIAGPKGSYMRHEKLINRLMVEELKSNIRKLNYFMYTYNDYNEHFGWAHVPEESC